MSNLPYLYVIIFQTTNTPIGEAVHLTVKCEINDR